jgi:hypothetical protein
MPFAEKQKSRRWTASLSLRFLARIKNHFNIRFSLQLTCVVTPIISILARSWCSFNEAAQAVQCARCAPPRECKTGAQSKQFGRNSTNASFTSTSHSFFLGLLRV